jgi:hypothetical protein
MPIRRMNSRWNSTPTTCAMRAEPMLEECCMISATFSGRFAPRKSLIVKRPYWIGRPASKMSESRTLPHSSAIAVFRILKVDPIS